MEILTDMKDVTVDMEVVEELAEAMAMEEFMEGSMIIAKEVEKKGVMMVDMLSKIPSQTRIENSLLSNEPNIILC
uniref:Uncharacterized protein n=1 Tax=Cucumis sativus TaxID=3659 RepID=A0A0A0L565_CUCSA